MIPVNEMIISSCWAVVPGTEIYLSSDSQESGREKDLLIKNGQNFQIESSFSRFIFDEKEKKLAPFISTVNWSSLLLLFGAVRCLLINTISASPGLSIELFRREDEDSGFYDIKAMEIIDALIVIYESGVFSVSRSGQVDWHVHKMWDDVFVSAREGNIFFLMSDGGYFSIDRISGARSLLQNQEAP